MTPRASIQKRRPDASDLAPLNPILSHPSPPRWFESSGPSNGPFLGIRSGVIFRRNLGKSHQQKSHNLKSLVCMVNFCHGFREFSPNFHPNLCAQCFVRPAEGLWSQSWAMLWRHLGLQSESLAILNYPLVNIEKTIEHGHVEIVDLPIKNGGSFHSCVTGYQRVVLKCLEYMDDIGWL